MLQYSIMNESLYGKVGDTAFAMKAFSGGGRGSTAGMERHDLRHWSIAKKAPASFQERNRGGPIPTGMYLVWYIASHPHYGECARLDATLSAMIQHDAESPIGFSVTDRDGFMIHGRGPKGSDGCIVPASAPQLHALLAAIRGAASPVTLLVHSPGMNADRLDAQAAWGHTA